jgi:hypothetical protein
MTDIVILVNETGVVEVRAADISDTEFVRDIHAAIERFDRAVRRSQRAAKQKVQNAPAEGRN